MTNKNNTEKYVTNGKYTPNFLCNTVYKGLPRGPSSSAASTATNPFLRMNWFKYELMLGNIILMRGIWGIGVIARVWLNIKWLIVTLVHVSQANNNAKHWVKYNILLYPKASFTTAFAMDELPRKMLWNESCIVLVRLLPGIIRMGRMFLCTTN